tara:strand:- start:757 stop:1269 length:513 start_codon:yes stop_codon:yes gene_type:complete
MKSDKNLVLIGMMGSGKSTIGFLLSKKISLKFIDIDKIIEKNEKMKISEIFKNKGEKYFRKVELDTTISVLNYKRAIIAIGGGAFVNNNIRKKILANHISVWLNWEPSTIYKRIKKNNKRPLAKNIDEYQINKMIFERSKKYSMANYKINCENLSKNDITKKIINLYENH